MWFPFTPFRHRSAAHHGNHRLVLLCWFPPVPLGQRSMAPSGNQPALRASWFPSTPPRKLSVASPGNQVCRVSGSGQPGTSAGQCRPGLQTARAAYAARHSVGRLSDGTARLSSRLCPNSSSHLPSTFCRRLWAKRVETTFPAEAGWMSASDGPGPLRWWGTWPAAVL